MPPCHPCCYSAINHHHRRSPNATMPVTANFISNIADLEDPHYQPPPPSSTPPRSEHPTQIQAPPSPLVSPLQDGRPCFRDSISQVEVRAFDDADKPCHSLFSARYCQPPKISNDHHPSLRSLSTNQCPKPPSSSPALSSVESTYHSTLCINRFVKTEICTNVKAVPTSFADFKKEECAGSPPSLLPLLRCHAPHRRPTPRRPPVSSTCNWEHLTMMLDSSRCTPRTNLQPSPDQRDP